MSFVLDLLGNQFAENDLLGKIFAAHDNALRLGTCGEEDENYSYYKKQKFVYYTRATKWFTTEIVSPFHFRMAVAQKRLKPAAAPAVVPPSPTAHLPLVPSMQPELRQPGLRSCSPS